MPENDPNPTREDQGWRRDLFFQSIVESYIGGPKQHRFIRRAWLAEDLEKQLQKPGCRFVLVSAEPGAGKSKFMAQLATDNPDWLRYFIRRDQRSAMADVSDKSLLLRIGFQLATLHPELFSSEAASARSSVSVTSSTFMLVHSFQAMMYRE
jgi:hypothetical protein